MKITEETIEEIRAIFTEREFNSRSEILQAYHEVGKLVQDVDRATLQGLAKQVGRSERTLYYAKEFYKTYPDMNTLPEGKNISINRIITKYLTDKDNPCSHDEIFTVVIRQCRVCKKRLDTNVTGKG